jgi:hypothetical protein
MLRYDLRPLQLPGSAYVFHDVMARASACAGTAQRCDTRRR